MQITRNAFFETGNQNSGLLLSTDLLSALRNDILAGNFTRGHKLTETRICSAYNVSRTPVREALHKLDAEGLIEMVPNKGAYVIGLSEQGVRDMFELRKMLEIQAVRWAASRITDEETETLEETFDFMEFYTHKNDVEKMLNINMNFHQIIYKASHNKMLHNMLSHYQLYTAHTKHIVTIGDSYLKVLLGEHRAIYEALKNKDAAAGTEAAANHMDKSLERYYTEGVD